MVQTIIFKSRKAQKMRNSFYVTLPQGVAVAWELRQGSPLEVILDGSCLIIKPKKINEEILENGTNNS